jgi:hypothetical protein
MSAIRNLIDAVAAIAEGVEGVLVVHRSSYERVQLTPAVAVELLSLQEDEPRELGAPSEPRRLMVRLSVVVLDRFQPDAAAAVSARDNVVDIQGRLRRALEDDPSLGGAALSSFTRRTRFGWETIGGAHFVVAAVLLDALVEDSQ